MDVPRPCLVSVEGVLCVASWEPERASVQRLGDLVKCISHTHYESASTYRAFVSDPSKLSEKKFLFYLFVCVFSIIAFDVSICVCMNYVVLHLWIVLYYPTPIHNKTETYWEFNSHVS